jgi:hypothetical protein
MFQDLLGKRFRKHGRPEWLRNLLLRLEHRRIASLPFYKINRPAGRMLLSELDHACVVDTKHQIFFHRIPKNANSSLVTSVHQLLEGNEVSTAIEDKRRLKKATQRPSLLDAAEAQKVGDYFKFLLVRNPYDRALSAYLSKAVKYAKEGKLRVPGRSRAAGGVPSFAEFCRFLADDGLYKNRHWSPQVDYLVFPEDRYDFVARLESIDTDFDILAKKLGRGSLGIKMVSEDPRHRTGAAGRRQEFYTPELYDLIFEVYRRDFEAFAYDKVTR